MVASESVFQTCRHSVVGPQPYRLRLGPFKDLALALAQGWFWFWLLPHYGANLNCEPRSSQASPAPASILTSLSSLHRHDN